MSTRSTRSRILAAVTAAISCVALAAGGIALAANGAPHPSQEGKKATICHKGKRTLRVSVHAVPAHLAHHDTLGACSGSTAAGATGHGKGKDNGKGEAKEKTKGQDHGEENETEAEDD